MKCEDNLDRELQNLGNTIAPEPSFVDDVMSQVSQTNVVPSQTTVFGRSLQALRHEWHLVFSKSFQYFAFGLVPWLDEEEVLLVSPLS